LVAGEIGEHLERFETHQPRARVPRRMVVADDASPIALVEAPEDLVEEVLVVVAHAGDDAERRGDSLLVRDAVDPDDVLVELVGLEVGEAADPQGARPERGHPGWDRTSERAGHCIEDRARGRTGGAGDDPAPQCSYLRPRTGWWRECLRGAHSHGEGSPAA
jgi:hypothetical protein